MCDVCAGQPARGRRAHRTRPIHRVRQRLGQHAERRYDPDGCLERHQGRRTGGGAGRCIRTDSPPEQQLRVQKQQWRVPEPDGFARRARQPPLLGCLQPAAWKRSCRTELVQGPGVRRIREVSGGEADRRNVRYFCLSGFAQGRGERLPEWRRGQALRAGAREDSGTPSGASTDVQTVGHAGIAGPAEAGRRSHGSLAAARGAARQVHGP